VSAAFVALVAASIGLAHVLTGSEPDDSHPYVAAPGGTATATAHGYATTPGPVGVDTRSSGTSVSAPSIRHQGRLTLNFGYVADLDSQAPNWGVGGEQIDDDLGFGGCGCEQDGIGSTGGADIAPASGPAAYGTCEAATAYGFEFDADTTKVGTTVCVRTGEGRYANLAVTALAHNDRGGLSSVTFQVVVWEKAS
jgi:hypothetical protein